MEKLDPQKIVETYAMEYGRDDVQYNVTMEMVVTYLQETHLMPRGVAVAVTDHLWEVWEDVAEDGNVKQGDLIKGVLQGWIQ